MEFESGATGVHTLSVVASFDDRRMCLSGSRGAVDGSVSRRDFRRWRRFESDGQGQSVPVSRDAAQAGWGGPELLDAFAAFVAMGDVQALDPAQASVSVALGVAATLSSDSGRAIALEELSEWGEIVRALAWR